MDEDTVEIGDPRVVGDVVIRPIARRRIRSYGEGPAGAVLARLTPVGIVVERDGSSRALTLDGEALPDDVLDELDLEA